MMRERDEQEPGRKRRAADGKSEPRSATLFEEQLDSYGSNATSTAGAGRRSRIVNWAAFTSAATAATAMAGTAEATIIYSGLQMLDVGPLPAAGYSGFTNLDIDLDGNAVNDIRARVFNFYYGEFQGGDLRGLRDEVRVARVGAPVPAKNFGTGSSIGSSGNFGFINGQIFDKSAGGFNSQMGWSSSGAAGLAGVEFDGHYGWIRVEVVSADHMRIIDWAYQSEIGVPIAAGSIPEPSAGAVTGLGLLALGAAGVRRRRATGRSVDPSHSTHSTHSTESTTSTD